jgi:hypothetical protein
MNHCHNSSTRLQQARTAIERIDEHLRWNGWDYDRESINLARRLVFGDDAFDGIESPNNSALPTSKILTANES